MLENDDDDDDDSVLLEPYVVEDGYSTTEIIIFLGIFLLMMGIGASCERQLFLKIIRSPKALQAVTVGISCQFLLLPFIAYLLTVIFRVDGYTAFGFIIVGSMPGGGSSNVFTMLSQGVLELSVVMTIISTIASFGLTPLWLFVYTRAIGLEDAALAFDEIGMAFAILIVPLLLGAALNVCAPSIKQYIEKVLGIFSIVVFVAAIVTLAMEYPDALGNANFQTIVPAILLFPIATGLSYSIAKLLQLEPAVRRTIVMEVGIQNLALGFGIGELSVREYSQRNSTLPFPLIYAFCMYGFGFLLIPIFRRQKKRNEEQGIVDNDPNIVLKEVIIPNGLVINGDVIPQQSQAADDDSSRIRKESKSATEEHQEPMVVDDSV